MIFKYFKKLRQQGILGINQRNADYVLKYNQRRYYPLVDNKIKSKQLALQAGIAVPELYGIIETDHQLSHMQTIFEKHHDFVIKPAHGAGGDGIIVITDKHEGRFRRANKMFVTCEDLEYHVSNILGGMYSLGGHRDQAMIEYRVQFSSLFEKISYQGVPDIRIIVLKGYPVMAMVRLPTRQSQGKANLHQGAIGVGIDIATGFTLEGVWFNERINVHPDTSNSVAGVQIPHWDTFLSLAAQCYELTNLGYLGVDLVLDKHLGPMILEMNARPGLNIQLANNHGLLGRLEQVEAIQQQPLLADRVAFSRATFKSFGGALEQSSD